jgi:hypothetical protein
MFADNGKSMPHLEEILNAYRVNSGEPYVFILEDMAILSQALKREGATTIPQGSSGQETAKRTAA